VNLLLAVGIAGCGSSDLSAQEKRNNFDACKIQFLTQVPQETYLGSKAIFDKQADENCGALLTLNGSVAENFTPKKPVIPSPKAVSTVSMKDVCKLVNSAAYAHNEFDHNEIGETIDYDVWYSRIQGYFKKATVILRKLPGDNTNLVSAAEQASLNARGVNAFRLTQGEVLLYSTCNISEEKVYENFNKWGNW
jgi:hypothetical protein